MSALQIALIFVGVVVTASFSYAAARYAGKSSVKVKKIDVDAAAYERAERINVAAFARIEAQAIGLQDQVKGLQDQVKEMQKSLDEQSEQLAMVGSKADAATQDLGIAINWLEQFLMWEQEGGRQPRPHIPAALRKHISEEILLAQRQEQLEHNREEAS